MKFPAYFLGNFIGSRETLQHPTVMEVIIDRPHTFKSIAREMGVTDRTVKNWWTAVQQEKEREIGTIVGNSRRFTESEKREIVGLASVATLQQPTATLQPQQLRVIESGIVPTVSTEIELPSTFDLSSAINRLDGAKGEIAQSRQLVDMVELIAGKVADTLDGKVADQEIALRETKREMYRLDAIMDSFQRRTVMAAQTAKDLAKAQTEATESIKAGVQEVTDLGKPLDSSRPPSS